MKKVKEDTVSAKAESVLTPAEYWEWKNAVTDMWLQEAKEKNEVLRAENIALNAKLTESYFKIQMATKVQESKKLVLDSKENYLKIKNVIEERLGISLANKMIDEVSLKVLDTPADN